MSKNKVETEGPQMTSQYGAYALHAGKARLYSLTLMHTRPDTHMHARMPTHAHIDQQVILTDFPRQQWFTNVIRTLPLLFSSKTVYMSAGERCL
jgi:hypothetical protein